MVETPSITQLSQVISHAIAPAFMLGAVSGFISVLVTRLNRIIDRCRSLHGVADPQQAREPMAVDMPRLNSRATLINHALFWAVARCTSNDPLDDRGLCRCIL
jgi:hypothetical protein